MRHLTRLIGKALRPVLRAFDHDPKSRGSNKFTKNPTQGKTPMTSKAVSSDEMVTQSETTMQTAGLCSVAPAAPVLIIVDQQRFVSELIALRRHNCQVREVEAMRDLERLELEDPQGVQLLIDPEMTDLGDHPGSSRILTDGRLRRIMQAFGNQVLLFSANKDRKLNQRFLRLGASGLLSKTVSSELLFDRLDRIWARRKTRPITQRAIASRLSLKAWSEQARFKASCGLQPLSRRQQQVLRLLEQGHPNKLIAQELEVSLSTVKSHVSAVLKGLGARNRLQAVFKASSSAFEPTARLPASKPDC
ncbi:MAG: DNA-binding response regulator [Betaproteobacteria bacterium]|nr:DNA-binding response regulator [Betaproteobacteria bacterium]